LPDTELLAFNEVSQRITSEICAFIIHLVGKIYVHLQVPSTTKVEYTVQSFILPNAFQNPQWEYKTDDTVNVAGNK
jgi:hypothetical protein